jgi:hypothetical protein
MLETNKISEVELEVTKEIVTPIQTETKNYKREFIENQIIEITKQRDEMIALKEAELLECQTILAEMDKQGIITEVENEKRIEGLKESLQVEEYII